MQEVPSIKALKLDDNNELILSDISSKSFTDTTSTGSIEKIVLAGGFSDLADEAAPPFSPTLLLNSELGVFNDDELKRIAESELRRIQSVKLTRYEIDADPRLCVISDQQSHLDDFIDAYGGVLEIEPLLVGNDSADYPEVVDIAISHTSEGYSIWFQKRSPISEEKCTYCGACGRICPEKCISPELHIQMTSCTRCKECEKICPVSAIDIHGVIEATISVPSLLILGEPKIELPEQNQSIFTGDRLKEYFTTVFSSEIKEVVCHNNTICQYSTKIQMGCGRCIDRCPVGALTRSTDGIVVNHLRCVGCGSCISICPTGSMESGFLSDENFARYLDGVSLESEKSRIVIGESDELKKLWWYSEPGSSYINTFFLEHPIPASLSSYHFLLLFASGFNEIVLLKDSQLTASKSFLSEIEKVNAVTQQLFGCQSVTRVSSDELALETKELIIDRSVFALSDYYESTRRNGLSTILQGLLTIAPGRNSIDSSSFDFSQIICDSDKCTHCLACLGECKTLALQTDSERLQLNYSGGSCVSCGVCGAICPEDALSMQSVDTIDTPFFNKRLLAESEAAKCKGCGKVFGARKSLDRVFQILSQKESVNTDHFEYCGDCRVVNLFKAEQ